MSTKDLLGTDQPETPAMTDPLPLRVFRLNDCEWWLAATMEEAKADYLKCVGPMEDEEAFDEPRELSADELDRLKFVEDREVPRSQWVRCTFREELARQIASGDLSPRLFACTEY